MYSPTSAVTTIVSLAVLGLSHYGIVIAQNDVLQLIAGIVGIVSSVMQYFAHRNLASATGRI